MDVISILCMHVHDCIGYSDLESLAVCLEELNSQGIVEQFIDASATVEERTPLMYAVIAGSLDACGMLIR